VIVSGSCSIGIAEKNSDANTIKKADFIFC
jgi:hypothetical protein